MDKYLVKPTKIIDENGYSQTITEHVVTHSSGTSGGADQAQINALSKRVYDLEQINGPINDRIDEAEATANDAKHTADVAHNVAKEVYDDFDMLNSVAANAEKLALEAKYSSETNAEEMTSLKARVADLEETNGTATVGWSSLLKDVKYHFARLGTTGKYTIKITGIPSNTIAHSKASSASWSGSNEIIINGNTANENHLDLVIASTNNRIFWDRY